MEEDSDALFAAHKRILDQLRQVLMEALSLDQTTDRLDELTRAVHSISKSSNLFIGWNRFSGNDDALSLFQQDYNQASDRAEWAPVRRVDELVLHVILFDPRVRSGGLGRHVLNVLTQSITRNMALPSVLRIEMCHFPIFYIADSFYGFLRLELIEQGTRAEEIYPRHWPARLTKHQEENAKAIYAYTDLAWWSPLEVALARVSAACPELEGDLRPLLRRLNADLANLYAPFGHTTVGDLIAMGPLEWALGTGHEALASPISKHCIDLGYSDKTTSATGNVMAVSFGDDLLRTLGKVNPALSAVHVAAVAAQMILAFCIDHCRVMYRPLVLPGRLVDTLCALLVVEDLCELFLKTDPYYAPHFEKLPGGTGGDCRHLWVPVKKPHSSNYKGDVYVPPPEHETPPMLITTLAAEPPTKKRRVKAYACLHCNKGMSLSRRDSHAPKVAFCGPPCARDYYLADVFF
jgi:hypothetical protein